MKIKDVKTIIFDYDGTIHESYHIYHQSFLKAYDNLVMNHNVPPKIWKSDDIKSFLGQNPKEMWDLFEPKISELAKQESSRIISLNMKELIEQGHAKLYDQALEVLAYLKNKGYDLIYLSNSKRYYMDANRKAFNLDSYFKQMICSEDYQFISKVDIVKQIRTDLNEQIIIIGDRIHDIEAGYKNDLLTIGCSYGYGTKDELKNATYLIHKLTDLYDLL